MNDPWDVKSVRLGHQYQSCIKINGVPILPPVLSKECRKEMQYYRLLAKEVEKRISILKPYIDVVSENEDKTDAPNILDQEEYESPLEENVEATIDYIVDKLSIDNRNEPLHPYSHNNNNLCPGTIQDSQIVIDLNVKIGRDFEPYDTANQSLRSTPLPDDNEVPERDCDYQNKNEKPELLTDQENQELPTKLQMRDTKTENEIDNIKNCDLGALSDKEDYVPLPQDGPSSLSLKSFTGSLIDIHTDSSKEAKESKLVRQRSYTVLQPSPQLLAHLEGYAIDTGVDINAISMSESMSQINHSSKKRKSWDLESAKVKWSSMALELKTKNIVTKANSATNNDKSRNTAKTLSSPIEKVNLKSQVKQKKEIKAPKSDPAQRVRNRNNSLGNAYSGKSQTKESPSLNTVVAVKMTPKCANIKKEDKSNKELISQSDDPAARVRELYEKLQKQQLMQMTNLMEKQKKEQELLKQVFEEQNNILLKQLKTVCPKASFEVKQAWGDSKDDDNGRGPVSLSQLMNTSTPNPSIPNSPVSKTLVESNNYIEKCEDMLKKSRDITNSIRKQTKSRYNGNSAPKSTEHAQVPQSLNAPKSKSPPNRQHASRRLEYDNLTSSDFEPLTDRSNDTLADLNVTFPSDSPSLGFDSNVTRQIRKQNATRACSPMSSQNSVSSNSGATAGAIKTLENTIYSSINPSSNRSVTKHSIIHRVPNTKELVAATKIVAYAKGYLVRRLMRTERVQSTVQTIRDALLCALQLHQDREGIRGADVDLHRRLIQQITSACYTLHDTFVTTSASERCAMIAADRIRKQTLANKLPATPTPTKRVPDIMSQSHSGAFPSRTKRVATISTNLMTQSNYETFNSEKPRSRYMTVTRRVPWR